MALEKEEGNQTKISTVLHCSLLILLEIVK